MDTKKAIIRGLLITLIVLIGFALWYEIRYSMDVAETYEVNPEVQQNSFLIATQGSKYKNAIVDEIVKYYGSQSIYIKVTDVTNLGAIDESAWNAIFILHTWEISKPQVDAEAFLASLKDQNKVVVLATSGEGDLMIEGVDGISGASVMSEVPTKVTEIKSRLNAILVP